MANEQQLHRRTLETRSSAYDEEEEELELQLEVKSMAESILHYRTTLPGRLNKTFGLLITNDGDQNPDVADQLKLLSEVALPEEDQETAEKISLLKLKISSNNSATPIILGRMKEAISRINKLELQKSSSSIHPAFKRNQNILLIDEVIR